MIDYILNAVLRWFCYRVAYVCEWGVYDRRYDSLDYMMVRPIHKCMGCAPPWAKRKILPLSLHKRPYLHEVHEKDCNCSYCGKRPFNTARLHYGLNIPKAWHVHTAWYVIKYWRGRYIRFTLPASFLGAIKRGTDRLRRSK